MAYLAIQGLVTLADLLSLLVAAGGDQLQYRLLVTAYKSWGHLSLETKTRVQTPVLMCFQNVLSFVFS